MPPRNESSRLSDIREAIHKIRKYTKDLGLNQFASDEKTIDAVVHNLSIIGEAVRHLSESFKSAHPKVPWHKISGMRNLIAREYFRISPTILWQTVDSELYALESVVAVPGTSPIKSLGKIHPWRLCPSGYHPVRTHEMKTAVSEAHPDGETVRHFHCALNPSGKDSLEPFEIGEIANKEFSSLKKMSCGLKLTFPDGSKFDHLIAGWTQYWNEVLKPKIPLDPNLVKALIASESGFDPKNLADKNDPRSARGLLQVTQQSRVIMGNIAGELKSHFISLAAEELDDPNLNICAGIRWLFYKQRLNRKVLSWRDTVWEYKGLRSKAAYKGLSLKEKKKKIANVKKIFNSFYEKYSKC